MFISIDASHLASVTGGASCAKYKSSPAELARRSRMSKAQRRAADRAWEQVRAKLSPDRLAAVRAEAASFAGAGSCTASEPISGSIIEDQLGSMRF